MLFSDCEYLRLMQSSILDLGKSIKFFKVGGKVRGILRVGPNVTAFECDQEVAYAYFRILIERQKSKRNSGNSYLLPDKKEAAPVPPLRSGSKGEASGKAPAKGATTKGGPVAEDPEPHHGLQYKLHKPNLKNLKTNCKQYCTIVTYVLLGVIAILVSIGVIVVTGVASVATKIYDSEQSSRLVAMIVLAVTAAISLSTTIYAIIGAVRKHTKPVHATGVVLVILAIIQGLIAGVAIHVTARDELAIGKSLQESFRLAKEDNQRHVKIWSATQNDLHCCGVYGPEDYRDLSMPYYFPPNVPVSCCPTFDPTKAPYNQERPRELCKVNGAYHDSGCRGLVVQVFKETSVVVITITVLLIVCELLLTITGVVLNRRKKKAENEDEESHPTHK